MDKKTLEDLAYTIKYCKDNNKSSMPIIFLGAGASASAGIPLTGKIIDDVYEKFKDKPSIIAQKASNNRDYYEVMKALRAEERQDLFKSYIENPEVKLNLANIYLAQLLKEKYVDYVFTVNFDDLLLKACALFNFIPPVYDISNSKKLNTNKFVKNSVVYLHGQYFGQWLLNTSEETASVRENVNHLFQRVCDRPWIVVGYSGEDEVFDELNKIGSFASDLYWVSFDDNKISDKVSKELLNKSGKNAYVISNIDADTFFIKLSTELGIPYPHIFDKPFTFLESMFENIKAVEVNANSEYNELYQNLAKQRDISLNWVQKAKNTIQDANTIEKLQQEIVSAIINKDFSNEKANEFEKTINDENYIRAKSVLSSYYYGWGNYLCELASEKNDEELYKQCFEKYEKASQLNSIHYGIYFNWGNALSELAELTKDEELYHQIFEKYEKASELNPKYYGIYYNWGVALCKLARLTEDEKLYLQSFEKYETASELNPKNEQILNNWGIALFGLAKLKNDKGLYDEKLYRQSIEKYETANELNPNDGSIYNNWGIALYELAKIENDEKLFNQAQVILEKGVQLGSKVYILVRLYAVRQNKTKALALLNQALANKEVTIKLVEGDEDWAHYKDDVDFINLLNSFK